MSTSPAQVAANRTNSLRSTGPRTSEGRSVSSLNARKHGLRSETVPLLPNEDRGEWAALLSALRNEWLGDDTEPSPTEELLVARMAASEWKRRRCEHFEIGVLAMEGCDDVGVGMAAWRDANKSQALGLFVRYRRAAEAAFMAAMHELERAQARRKGSMVPLPVAVELNVTSDVGEQRDPEE